MSDCEEIAELLEIMTRLRHPTDGCPWDCEQDFQTIAPHTIEEAYEVADAISRGDMGELREELGDLLFQVVYHARMAEELGHFDFFDVVRGVSEKLVRRHPHVFGNAEVESVEAQSRAWEMHKAKERKAKAGDAVEHSHLDGVSVALPALTRAVKLQRRAARVGFDWPEIQGVVDKVGEEFQELADALGEGDPARLAHEVGDLFFSCVNLARHLRLDPETALREASSRFEDRFRRMESLLRRDGKVPEEATLAEMDAAWERIKAEV